MSTATATRETHPNGSQGLDVGDGDGTVQPWEPGHSPTEQPMAVPSGGAYSRPGSAPHWAALRERNLDMTTKTQDAPGETRQDLNDAPVQTGQQEPATTIEGWSICTLDGVPVQSKPNDWGSCIDVVCDRLGAQKMLAEYLETDDDEPVELRLVRLEVFQAGQSSGDPIKCHTVYVLHDEEHGTEHCEGDDGSKQWMFYDTYEDAVYRKRCNPDYLWANAQILSFVMTPHELPVASTGPRQPQIATVPAQLYAIRAPSGEWADNDINDEPKVWQVHCFRSFDEAATARLMLCHPDSEIVPLVEAMRPDMLQPIAATSPIARRPKEVYPTTLYGLRCCDEGNGWFYGNESQMRDGVPNVHYIPTFKSEDDARKYLAAAGMTEAVPNGDDNHEAYAIMPLLVARANDETSERSETSDADEPKLAPLPSEETLDGSGAVTEAIEDELSWLSDQEVIDADEGVKVVAPLRDFLKLVDRFDGSCRIRKSRTGRDEPRRRLIIEDGGGYNVLPARAADQVIGTMVHRKLCEFDSAGVLHVADKGRALIGTK